MPTISVLVPNYNRGRMLQEAVRSVVAQNYQDFEILAVYEGATEEIPATLAPFGDRVRYMVSCQAFALEEDACMSARPSQGSGRNMPHD